MVEPTFSERMGSRRPKMQQLDEVDDDLQISLWNAVIAYRTILAQQNGQNAFYFEKFLAEEVWSRHLKWPLDRFPQGGTGRDTLQSFWEFVNRKPTSRR